jgi:AcrR family transcriptional regulator
VPASDPGSSAAARAPRSARKAQAQQTRSRLLAAAAEQFSERDYEDVSVSDIASAAGAAHGLLFHYFGSKRALYLEVIGQAAEQLARPLPQEAGVSVQDQLRDWLRQHLRYLAEHQGLALRLVLGGRGADAEAWEVFESGRWRVIESFCERLGLDPASNATTVMMRAGVGAVDEATVQWLGCGQPFEVDAFADVLVTLLASFVVAAGQLDPSLDIERVAARASEST